jgi:hypothetical protein
LVHGWGFLVNQACAVVGLVGVRVGVSVVLGRLTPASIGLGRVSGRMRDELLEYI